MTTRRSFGGEKDTVWQHLDLSSFTSILNACERGGTMRNIRKLFPVGAVALLLVFYAVHAWAGEKIAVVQYDGLKPVEYVDNGRSIKTKWSAKIRNGASETVNFSVTVVLVDSNNETLKEATSKCELGAHETKSFSDTVLVDASVAKRIASTRLTLQEIVE